MNQRDATGTKKKGNPAMFSSGRFFEEAKTMTTDSSTVKKATTVSTRRSGHWASGMKVPLPIGYVPSPDSVVVGRGGHTMGKSRLRMIAAQFLEPYSQATTKHEKSPIVTKIIKLVEEKCPYGAFVKLSEGRWWLVDESKARETVGYILRDLLHDRYRSSAQSKAALRRQRAAEKVKTDSQSFVASSFSPSCSSKTDLEKASIRKSMAELRTNLKSMASSSGPVSGQLYCGNDCAHGTNQKKPPVRNVQMSGQKVESLEQGSFHGWAVSLLGGQNDMPDGDELFSVFD